MPTVSKTLVDILVEKGFNLTEIGKLAKVDRATVSHVYHETQGYSGKKVQDRLFALLNKSGYTEQQRQRIEDTLYRRTIPAIVETPTPTQTIPVQQVQVIQNLPTCNFCTKSVPVLIPVVLKNRGDAPFLVCQTCMASLYAKKQIVRALSTIR